MYLVSENFDSVHFIGEGPIGDGRSDEISFQPQARPAVFRILRVVWIEPCETQHNQCNDQHHDDAASDLQ